MAKRYAWLGTTRKATMRDVVLACFDAWLFEWCLQPEECKASVEEVLLASCPREDHVVWMTEVAGGCLLLALGQNRLDALGGAPCIGRSRAKRRRDLRVGLCCCAGSARTSCHSDWSRPYIASHEGWLVARFDPPSGVGWTRATDFL